ncbi:MAG: hypothetical protein R6V38_02460 [Roseovarius gahaiensis]
MKLKHVDELSGGRKRFRRRYPKAVSRILGEEFFQVPMRARDGAALVAEQENLLAEYDKLVAKVMRKAAGKGQLSLLQHWREATAEAEAVVAAIKGGLDDGDRREVLAEDLYRRGADPILVKAVVQPEAEEPPVTLLDAKTMYQEQRMGGATGRNQRNRLERVCRRVERALGPLRKLALVDLKRAHGRKLRDFMLAQRKADGSLLSPLSVRRELDMVRAIVSLAIVEFDLRAKAQNPFEGLELLITAEN